MKKIIIFMKHVIPFCLGLMFVGSVLIVMNVHLLFSAARLQGSLLFYKVLVFAFNAETFRLLIEMQRTLDLHMSQPDQILRSFEILEADSTRINFYLVSVFVKFFEDCTNH